MGPTSGETRAQGRARGTMPCVAIAREVGADAGKVAERVAQLLGYSVCGRELTGRVARKLGVAQSVIRRIEARRSSLWEGLREGMLGSTLPTGAAYRVALTRVVDDVCTQGGSVIVGRGAALLVRPEQALRVRVVCPLEVRVLRHAARFGLTHDEALHRVQRADREQQRFGAQLTGTARVDASVFDLVVSTAELSIEAAARVVEACFLARFQAGSKRPAHRVEDVLQ